MKKITLKITLSVEEDTPVSEAKEYSLEALEAWGGQRHPDDPFFGMRGRVEVRTFMKTRRSK